MTSTAFWFILILGCVVATKNEFDEFEENDLPAPSPVAPQSEASPTENPGADVQQKTTMDPAEFDEDEFITPKDIPSKQASSPQAPPQFSEPPQVRP